MNYLLDHPHHYALAQTNVEATETTTLNNSLLCSSTRPNYTSEYNADTNIIIKDLDRNSIEEGLLYNGDMYALQTATTELTTFNSHRNTIEYYPNMGVSASGSRRDSGIGPENNNTSIYGILLTLLVLSFPS